MTGNSRISLERIKAAVDVIDPVFLNSPQYLSQPLSALFNAKIYVKIETDNPVKSFKGRGAELLASTLEDVSEVTCASAGNFGQALAYSCAKKNIILTVFASSNANPLKVERMQQLGANVILYGDDLEDCKSMARYFLKRSDAKYVEDSLNIETVEGAGTIGLELLKLPEKLDYLLIALGNGALLTGVATVFKQLSPETKIIAIQASGASAMIDSWKAKTVINHDTSETIADGIAVRMPIPEVLQDMEGVVDEGILVKDETIKEAMKLLKESASVIAEPAAAVGIAAIIEHKEKFKNKTLATIICGGNVSE